MPPDALTGCRRILLVRPDNIGDVVLLAPAIRAIRSAHPDATIGLLASPAGATATVLLPSIDEVMVEQVVWQDASPSPKLDPDRELGFIERLRAGRWDALVIFTSFSQTAFGAAYAGYLAGIPVRAGHARDFGGALLTHPVAPPEWEVHQAERALDLVEGVGIEVADRTAAIEIPPAAIASVERLLATTPATADGYILIVPGASCAARRYPPERYAEAARTLHERTGMPIVVAGTQKEADRMGPAFLGVAGVVSVMGRTAIAELAALVAASDLVVCGNSAALHLADALRRPVVAMYSGTELESQWRPRQSPSILLRRETACSPCYRFECPFEMQCLDIEPSEVVDAALRLLGLGTRIPAQEEPCAVSAS